MILGSDSVTEIAAPMKKRTLRKAQDGPLERAIAAAEAVFGKLCLLYKNNRKMVRKHAGWSAAAENARSFVHALIDGCSDED